jgi:hypothetical protein
MRSIEYIFPLENIRVPGIARACLWDAHEIPVRRYIRELQDINSEIRYCRKRYMKAWWKRLVLVRHHIICDFENCIDRIWNDQKTGTYFKKGERFEPHQAVKQHNLIMWDGLTRFTELIAGENSGYFVFKKMGIGTTTPTYNDQGLENEVATCDMRINGGVNSDGMVLKDTGVFDPGVPSNTISEFCATDDDAPGGTIEYRVVIERASDRLGHIQDVTEVQESHSIVFQAVTNEV